jgi:Fic family protein
MDSAQPCKSSFLRSRVVAINALIGYRMTGQEIQEKIEKQDRFIHLLKVKPTNVEHHRREEALHRRNMENRRLNEEQVRSVQLAERKRKKEAARNAQLKREEAVRMAANGGIDPNKDNGLTAEKKVISQYIPRDYTSGLKDFTKIKNDDEMIAEMDFDIDVEI